MREEYYDEPYDSIDIDYDRFDEREAQQMAQKLDSVEYYFTKVINVIYGRERLDLDQLHDDLCSIIDEFPAMNSSIVNNNLPNIERRKTEIFKFATELALLQKVR